MDAAALPVTARSRRGPRALLRAASDDRLVARLRSGDDAAFEAIYDRHHRDLLAFCRHMLGSREEAEDALQLVFLSMHRHLRTDDRPVRIKPWLYAVARNRCLSVLRARREAVALDDVREPSTDGLVVADEVERRQDLKAMLADLGGLPDQQRAALLLSELGGLSHDDIAEVLGVRRDEGQGARLPGAGVAHERAQRTRRRLPRDPRAARDAARRRPAALDAAPARRDVSRLRRVQGRGQAPAQRARADPAGRAGRGRQEGRPGGDPDRRGRRRGRGRQRRRRDRGRRDGERRRDPGRGPRHEGARHGGDRGRRCWGRRRGGSRARAPGGCARVRGRGHDRRTRDVGTARHARGSARRRPRPPPWRRPDRRGPPPRGASTPRHRASGTRRGVRWAASAGPRASGDRPPPAAAARALPDSL